MRLFYNSKKGFDANQIFIFVTAVIVVGFVILFGAKTIGKFIGTGEDVDILTFKNDLEQKISLVGNDHGSTDIFKDTLPGNLAYICFIDLTSAKTGSLNVNPGVEIGCPQELTNITVKTCPIWKRNADSTAQPKNIILVETDKSVHNPIYIPGIRLEHDTGVSIDTSTEITCIHSRRVELFMRGERGEAFLSLLS